MGPRWLDRAVGFLLTGIVGFALVAVPLAMAGLFHPLPVLTGSAVVWFVVWRLSGFGAGSYDDPKESPQAGRAAVVVLAVIAVLTGLNVRYSSQHVLTERDPGVYVTTARWLVRTGDLLVDPVREPYRGVVNEHRIQFAAAGYYEGQREDGRLYPQFVHLLPATLGASVWAVGTRGMLKVNALLGGFALVVFFLFATRLMRPWAAAGATAALGAGLIQVHFSRDAYTEILTQILLFGGLWVLLSARRTLHRGRAAVAGLLVGTASMARIDAFIFLVPLALYIVYEVVSAHPLGKRHRDYLVWLAGGTVLPSAVAFADARLFSPVYLSALWSSVRLVWLALALVAVGGIVLVRAMPRIPSLRKLAHDYRPHLATAAAAGIVGLALLAYFVRPQWQTAFQENVNRFVETLQRREDLAIDGTRTYAENTMRWLVLYLGHPALWAGVVGVALMTRDVLLGHVRKAVPFVLFFLPMTVLYVWEPTITPDHPWALRRFLPITIPGLGLACFWLIDRWWPVAPSRKLRRAALAVLAASAVAFPAWTFTPAVTARTQRGLLDATDRLCAYLPDDAAVLVAQTQLLDQNLTQTVRAFCGVPSATAPMDQPLDWYRELARRWQERGRSFYVVSPQEGFGLHWPLDIGERVTTVTYRNLERTLTGRPDGYETFTLALFAKRIDPSQPIR